MIPDLDVGAKCEAMLSRYDLNEADVAIVGEALEVILLSLKEEPLLSQEGFERQIRIIDGHLQTLEALTADRRRYPEIAEVEIVKPVFITGLGRSGTTFLHSLLSRDPSNRCPLSWETELPSPPPEAATYETDPRITQCEEHFRSNPASPTQDLNNKEMQKKHLSGPLLTEEDKALLRISLRMFPMTAGTRILRYFHWLLEQDATPQYLMHKRFLQHLQWRNPRKRWVLKSPTHMHNLPTLLQVYPDARIVWCHRDPAPAISSMTSVMCTYRRPFMTVIDPPSYALEYTNYWDSGVKRAMDYRRTHPDVPIFDIGHSQIVTDPMGSVRRVYDHFDISLDAAAERRLLAFIDENPREKHGAHSHGIERFGMTTSRIHEIFHDYIKTFRDYL